MTDTLALSLQSCNMILIDGLHAFDFSLADDGALRIESMDGRELKRWNFSAEQLAAALFDEAGGAWTLSNETSSHQVVCLSAFSASDEEDPAEELEQE